MFFGKKQSLVGLDIGSHSVKVVELEAQANKQHRLVNWGISQPLAEAIVDGEIALEHQRHVVERTQVERAYPEGAHERHVRDRERERRHRGEDPDPCDQQEDHEPPKDRRSPSGVLIGARRAPTRRRHDRAKRTSSATSVGVRPTPTPAASRASALAVAVPLEPVMIAPA